MRTLKYSFLILFILFFSSIYSQNKYENYTAEQYLQEKGEVYFQFDVEDIKDIYKLTNIISIDHLNGNTLKAYANKKQFKKILQLGYKYEVLQHPGTLINPKMMSNVDIKNIEEWDFYPTYEAYIDMMNQFATDYPDLCQVFSIGQTTDGRELMVAKISDNIGIDENEPEFLYTSTMHGDETTGYPLMLRLIDYLLSNYGTDARITNIVNEMEIFINPLANPDGTYFAGNNSVNGAIRLNANSIDLNRNYPDPRTGPHPDNEAWQEETIAFMDFADEQDFVLSCNIHGGIEVCNYPWDTFYPPPFHADDDWWKLVCNEYADTAQANSPSGYMFGIGGGNGSGITNGALWYVITGGRQDYMNYFHHCREFTLEISTTKLLPENQLEVHWDYNYRSFLNYFEQTLYGIRGIVTDEQTGNPLKAFVEIIDYDADSSQVYSSMPLGNYHRPIFAGTYDVRFSADGYCIKIVENVSVNNFEATIIDIALEPCNMFADFTIQNTNIIIGEVAQFTDQSFGNIISWQWYFEGGVPENSTAQNPTVSYAITGDYDVKLIVSDGVEIDTLEKQDYINVNFIYLMNNGEVTHCTGLFYDDGGQAENYEQNKDYVLTFYPVDDQRNVVLDFTSFNVEYNSTCSYDWLKIYDGSDTDAALIGTFCGTDSPGTIEASNPEMSLTLEFHSDNSGSEFGWEAIISCNPGVKINEIENLENQITIIPNPVKNEMFSVESKINIREASMYSLSGKVVRQIIINQKKFDVNTSNLNAGMYLLQLKTDEAIIIKKIQIL